MSTGDGVIRALRRGMVTLLAVVLVRAGVMIQARTASYTSVQLEWIAFAMLVTVAVAFTILSTGDRTLDGSRAVLTVVTVVAAALATAGVSAESMFTDAHWSWYIVGWLFVAIHIRDRFAPIGWALALNLVLVLAQARLAAPLDRRDLAVFLLRASTFTSVQAAFGTTFLAVGRAARRATQIRERDAKALTEQRIADELLIRRREQHSMVATTTVPLLEGLAAGVLSPDDPAVQRRSIIEASRLRRLMAETDHQLDPLSHELRACVDVVERAGVEVDVAFRGSGPTPDIAGRRALTEPVIAALAEAEGSARVTVVSSEREVVVSVLASVPDEREVPNVTRPGPPEQGPGGVQVSVVRSAGRIWTTARWEQG